MAKIKMAGLAQDARGSVNGITFSKNASGAYCRQKVSPVQPQTSYQTSVRANFSDVSKRWSNNLTAANRLAWENFAQTHPVIDVFGDSMVLSGINTYMRINQILKQTLQAVIDVPPVDLDVTSLTSGIVTATAPNLVSIAFMPTPLGANERLYVWASGPIPQGKTFVKNMFKQILTGAANTSPEAAGVAYVARFGSIVAGQRIAFLVAVVDITKGAVSPGLRSTVTAV